MTLLSVVGVFAGFKIVFGSVCFAFVVDLVAFPGALAGSRGVFAVGCGALAGGRGDFVPLPLLAALALFDAGEPVPAPVLLLPAARVDAGIVLHTHGIVHQAARYALRCMRVFDVLSMYICM